MNKRNFKLVLSTGVLLVLVACGGSGSGGKPTGAIAFVDCPKFRDLVVGPPFANSCWIAEHKGTTYSLNGALGTPQLGHKILVEAVDTGSTDTFCGGKVLSEVKVSVLPEIDNSCQAIVGAEGITLPPPAPFVPPALTTEPATPYATTSFLILYPHQSSFIGTGLGSIPFYADVEKAAKLAIRGNAKTIVITGRASSTITSDGTPAIETTAIALERANKISEALQILGVPKSIIKIVSATSVPAADGANSWKSRSAIIDVII